MVSFVFLFLQEAIFGPVLTSHNIGSTIFGVLFRFDPHTAPYPRRSSHHHVVTDGAFIDWNGAVESTIVGESFNFNHEKTNAVKYRFRMFFLKKNMFSKFPVCAKHHLCFSWLF